MSYQALLSLSSVSFQDSWSPLLMYISSFHDYVMMVVIMVLSLVIYSMTLIMTYSCCNRSVFGNEGLELIWTVVPSVILGLLAIPSLYTLYLIDELSNSLLTIKIIGHQWYWSYEYSDFEGLEFDSYMIQTFNENSNNVFRLLEVDNNTVVPMKVEIRLIVTSYDVIHSWTIPSAGVKVDSVPGRLNQIFLFMSRLGLVYGQCSEICGAFHSFMPICLEVVSDSSFMQWVKMSSL